MRASVLTALAAIALAGGALTGTAASASAGTVNVTVNAGEGLGAIPATGYGLNSAVWDSQMNVPQVQGLLQRAGVRMLRYPGGSYGDIYHWQTNTAPGGYLSYNFSPLTTLVNNPGRWNCLRVASSSSSFSVPATR